MSAMPQMAMVLAAGLGARMRPLTDDRPKPLIEVAGKPLIDYALDRFAAASVACAVVNVHFFADKIERHLAARPSPQIIISDERSILLETGGGFKKAAPRLGADPVFCTNTDAILVDAPGTEACARLANAWDGDKMDALLLLVRPDQATGYDGAGDFELSANGAAAWRTGATAPYVFTGLQIISPRLLEGAPEGPFSMRVLWDRAVALGRLHGCIHQGDWMHVGNPSGLARAEARLSTKSRALR